jgi:hypothetical protein
MSARNVVLRSVHTPSSNFGRDVQASIFQLFVSLGQAGRSAPVSDQTEHWDSFQAASCGAVAIQLFGARPTDEESLAQMSGRHQISKALLFPMLGADIGQLQDVALIAI